MSSDTDLPNQPHPIQQPPLMKKKSNHSWTSFSILLLLINLPFVGLFIAQLIFDVLRVELGYFISSFIQRMINLSPFLIPLAIIDFIAIMSYIKREPPDQKKAPPWKVFFISLLAVNVIFFLIAGWTLSQTAGGVAGFFLLPFALILLFIDSIVTLSYIYMHLPDRRAKIMFYIALVSIALGLLVLSIFYSAHP